MWVIELQKHNVCQTKTLILPTNVDLFEGEQTRNQTDAIVFFLMTLISLFAIFYTAGVFSINQDIKLLKNQSSVLEKVN
jgi:hypothetical protein